MAKVQVERVATVYADDLPDADATLFDNGLFTCPDAPERVQLLRRVFLLDFTMFRLAKHRIRQATPVVTRAYHFDIAADFSFIAHQQSNMIAAVAQAKP